MRGKVKEAKMLFFYDELFNLKRTVELEGDICELSFSKGKYYVKIGDLNNSKNYYVCSSEDLQNWKLEESLKEVPLSNGKSEILYEYDRTSSFVTYTPHDKIIKSSIKLDKEKFYEVEFEKGTDEKVRVIDGIYVSKIIAEDGVYVGFSDDGVYYTRVKMPDDFMLLANIHIERTDDPFYDLGDYIAFEEHNIIVKFKKADIKSVLGQKEHTYVKVNDKILGFDTEPVIEKDRTLVPLRFIFETMGADVDWEDETSTAIVKKENAKILFEINNTTAMVNSAKKIMDVPARLIDDKTMVPLRFLSEELGFKVEWDEMTRTATISQ